MENSWEGMKLVLDFLFRNLFVWNMLFAVIIVFFQRRNPKSVWGWLLLLYFIPILGFVFYLFFGQNFRKRKMFKMKELEDMLSRAIRQQEIQLRDWEKKGKGAGILDFQDLVMYNLEISGAVLSEDNDVMIFTDGNAKFDALMADLRSAERFIHIQYYIIKNDVLFQRIKDILIEKASRGVEVRVLFDAMGCRSVKHRFWKELEVKGIMTAEFFPAVLGRFHMRMNYRNHRKIVVIDNKVAYVGGFNIGKEYIGLDNRFGYWRDTHLRICGSAVLNLQVRFILDWNYAARENLFQNDGILCNMDIQEDKIQNAEVQNGEIEHGDVARGVDGFSQKHTCAIQIISSGPDNRVQQIHDNYLRLITKAQKSIYIQTPYFVPDEAIMNALMIAVGSGIQVNIMIPCKPDHLFVYWATYSYIGDLVMAGAKCYTYDGGFLHSKGMIVDGRVLCYGTANMDIRSFALNFEVNAVVYDEEKALEMEEFFKEDLKVCTQITKDFYAERSLKIRIKEQICRLLSPLL